ncbi:Metallo-dependent phosphatase-like protein [Mycena venus]|uniref:Metallo-dependent phosphatase-like protein n=1 Tax=Mycena venus TaxID=2733690 RepID=A0A8H7CMR2_9AGAR|nr:Metallo-dependent phosphatase-like protein [Mycena venus]
MNSSLPVFETNTLRIVCTSDTHNDDPSSKVPDGDVFIHAGDLTDHSTVAEYTTVLDWVQALPHKVKILIAGNRDGGLDPDNHKNRFNPEALALVTSPKIKAKGIHYLDRETRTVAYYTAPGSGELKELRVYANPLQPEFSPNRWPLTYPPHPSTEAEEAWSSAPTKEDAVPIWVMHGPPLDRLDKPNMPGLIGCAVQMRKIAAARPGLCVFGHFHFSWGVERVAWNEGRDGIAKVKLLTLSEERKRQEGLEGPETRCEFNFSSQGVEEAVDIGRETVFVNAAWMTTKKTKVEDRNMPIVVTLTL